MELRLLGGRLVEVDFADGSDLGLAHFECLLDLVVSSICVGFCSMREV